MLMKYDEDQDGVLSSSEVTTIRWGRRPSDDAAACAFHPSMWPLPVHASALSLCGKVRHYGESVQPLYCAAFPSRAHRQSIMAGMFGRTEWDMKIPGMRSEEQYKAFRRVLLVRS